jgi:hypothetical protein
MSDDDDRVIQFPGLAGGTPPAPSAKEQKAAKPGGKAGGKSASKPTAEATSSPEGKAIDPLNLDEDRRKALSVIMSGMPFVCIGVQPSEKGADFFTSLGGDEVELAKAAPHLAGVIERLLQRRGIT